jgi:hypothetical protein
MNIPEIIAQQMGGAGALRMMLGASGIKAADDRTLEFRFAARAQDRITWSASGPTRPIPTGRIPPRLKSGVKAIDRYDGIYCDQLADLFERRTGPVLRPRASFPHIERRPPERRKSWDGLSPRNVSQIRSRSFARS